MYQDQQKGVILMLTVDTGPKEMPGEVVDRRNQLWADVAEIDGGPL